MTSNAAGRDRSFVSTGVDELLVTLAFGRSPDGPADEVFVLETRPPVPPGGRWDETPYVEALEGVLRSTGRPGTPHSLTVCTRHTSWGRPSARADIVLSVALAGTSTTANRKAREAVKAAFREMLGSSDNERRRSASHDEAVSAARRLVATVWSDVDAVELSVSHEEHRASTHAWSFGLVARDRTRYQALVGFVDGDPSTVHIRRGPEPEVVDSVGL